jgi:nucleoside-diphosphate-sugar epimerase
VSAKIIVTGGSGFIGSGLVKVALNDGLEPTVDWYGRNADLAPKA